MTVSVPEGRVEHVVDTLIGIVDPLWHQVLRLRAPQVLAWHDDASSVPIPTGDVAIPYLQALNIRFQLLRIADENAAVRERRASEVHGGAVAVQGSFAEALQAAALDSERLPALLERLSVGPTLTAHPTEAKRVTVLQIHRRIYRHLVALETDRWTPRERQRVLDDIAGEIDLLWLTGELRLERPSLGDEIEWGLQFFRNSLFDAVPQMLLQLQDSVNAVLPTGGTVASCIRFHSWIGGDRDGNPNVTTSQTELALRRGRDTILAVYRRALIEAVEHLSISNLILTPPAPHQDRLQAIVDRAPPPTRNPNELFRQAVSAMVLRLDDGANVQPYAHVGQLIGDLDVVQEALRAVDAHQLADRYLRPLRWQVETFGLRTTTLDIRQNSAVTTAVLEELWSHSAGPALEFGSADWSARLRLELADPNLIVVDTERLSVDARELIQLLQLMLATRASADPDAIGPFILSMTRSADDLLGVYLLARYAGFGAETLDLKVVPPVRDHR